MKLDVQIVEPAVEKEALMVGDLWTDGYDPYVWTGDYFATIIPGVTPCRYDSAEGDAHQLRPYNRGTVITILVAE